MRKISVVEPIENILSRGFDASQLKSMLPAISYPELRLNSMSVLLETILTSILQAAPLPITQGCN